MIAMQWTAWVTLAALVVYLWMGMNVGKARMKYKVPAPSMDGPVEFLSVERVQANTVEQFIIFLPALWLCAAFFSDRWAAAGGAVWIIGRIVYALGYYQSPDKRSAGFGITIMASFGLMTGAVVGLVMR